jgi:membrane fusion protein, multidrug efflux system
MRLAACLIWFICTGLLPAYAQQAVPPTTVPVGTVAAVRKPVAKSLEFVGRVEAINRVQIRARVTGYLEAVQFTEGDLVKEGAPLYQIEKGQFEAAIKQAKGALERSKAAKTLSSVQLKRAEELFQNRTGTEVARDQAVAADEQAAGAILESEANVTTAEINLGYTEITAPITGKVGRTAITKGNVVSPDTGVLTTIVSQDPMYVTFPVSQREFLAAQQAGQIIDRSKIKVRLRYPDGVIYDQDGVINFVDVSVDRATDTVTVRATVPNPKGGITDGQLMTVIVEAGKPEEKVTIPQSALIADQEGIYVFVVQDGKAVMKRVKVSGNRGVDAVIDSGVAENDLIIVQGLQSIRPGAPVRATPAAPIPGQG